MILSAKVRQNENMGNTARVVNQLPTSCDFYMSNY